MKGFLSNGVGRVASEGRDGWKGGEDVLCLIERSQSRSLMLQASLPDLKESDPKS